MFFTSRSETAPMNTRYDTTRPTGVLMVSTFSDKHGGAISESLGAEAIAGHLIGLFGRSVTVDHIDLQLDPSISKIRELVVRVQPSLVGISVKIGALDQMRSLVTALSALRYDDGTCPLIVLGGVVPTFAPAALLEEIPGIILVVREGENAMAGLIDYVRRQRPLSGVPGVAFKNEAGEMITVPSQRLQLAKRFLPARITSERVHNELGGMIWAEASRGCDFNCTFCSIRDLHGGGFDGGISPESVVADLVELERRGIQAVSFTDDDFGGDPERTAVIARLIKEAKLKIRFSISTRADHIWRERSNSKGERLTDGELLIRNRRLREIMVELTEAGLERVFIGMESGSPSQLKRYGKQVSVEGNYKALEILHELGIDVVAGYIPIDPAMNLTELQENIEFLRRTGMYRKITNPLSVLRVQAGSPYLKLAQQRGLLRESTDDLVFFKSRFEDARVQRVAEVADRWVEDMYVLMFGLKGEVASQTLMLGPGGVATPASRAVENCLFRFRELEMGFIEAVTVALAQKEGADLSSITSEFVRRRSILAADVVELVHSGVIGKNPRLQDAVMKMSREPAYAA